VQRDKIAAVWTNQLDYINVFLSNKKEMGTWYREELFFESFGSAQGPFNVFVILSRQTLSIP
jgi:hypothetical protein